MDPDYGEIVGKPDLPSKLEFIKREKQKGMPHI